MRFYNNNSFTAPGDLDAHMNPGSGEPFGIIGLGHSDICLDTVEDARALLAGAAKIVAWFEAKPELHTFESAAGTPNGPCMHCGHIKSRGVHAEPEPERVVFTDEGDGEPEPGTQAYADKYSSPAIQRAFDGVRPFDGPQAAGQ